jgi:hypothetical protein
MDEGGVILKQMLLVMILFQLTGSWAYIYLDLRDGHSGHPMTSYHANEHHRVSFGETQAVQDPEQNSNESRPR